MPTLPRMAIVFPLDPQVKHRVGLKKESEPKISVGNLNDYVSYDPKLLFRPTTLEIFRMPRADVTL